MFHKMKEGGVFHRDLITLLGMGSENEERPEGVTCYNGRDVTEELNLKKWRR